MKFRLYDEGGDKEVFVTFDGDKKIKEENDFVFSGFGNFIHPYHKKEMEWIKRMLESEGVVLNEHIVPTVHEFGGNADAGEFEANDLILPTNLKKSKDGITYVLIQDKEMGRGWAVLLTINAKRMRSILQQDHRDTVRDELLEGRWIRSFGIDYQKEEVKSLAKI